MLRQGILLKTFSSATKELPGSQGAYRGFARDDLGSRNANFQDRPLDLNPRESALIRGKNPCFFSVPPCLRGKANSISTKLSEGKL